MSKTMMRAFIVAQYASLTAKDNKERLRFTIAGVKDGKLYDHVGTEYGTFDEKAPDAIFIPDTDLQLSRITGAKIEGINKKMTDYFAEYFGESDEKQEGAFGEPSDVADVMPEHLEPEIDTDAVEKACKKAIKKGDFKKAQKLIDKLGGNKKLQKKLDKAQ